MNHKGLAQLIQRSVRGPDGTRPDGRLLWELAERQGLIQTDALRKEIAAAIPALAAISSAELKGQGVLLEEAVAAV